MSTDPDLLEVEGEFAFRIVNPTAEELAAVFAGASWQRCRTHFMANLSRLTH